jgi:hypothetical protein
MIHKMLIINYLLVYVLRSKLNNFSLHQRWTLNLLKWLIFGNNLLMQNFWFSHKNFSWKNILLLYIMRKSIRKYWLICINDFSLNVLRFDDLNRLNLFSNNQRLLNIMMLYYLRLLDICESLLDNR